MVQAAWGRGHPDVPKSLDVVWFDAKKFNLETFGNISHRKRVLEARIQGIHRCLETVDSLCLVLLEKELQEEYTTTLKQEELLWFQKSREN